MAGQNFTKLEVKLVKLSLKDKFVLEFRKVVPFLHKGHRQKKALVLFCPPPKKKNNAIGDTKLKKIDVLFSEHGRHRAID